MSGLGTVDAQEARPLKIGDYITLRTIRIDGFLGAEGILDQRCMVFTEPENFDDCRFQIWNQNQYSAAKELQEYVELMEQQDAMTADLASDDAGSQMSLEQEAPNAEEDIFDAGEEQEEIFDESSQRARVLQSLQKGRVNEQRLNESYMRQLIGNPVKFGAIVQLRHVKSGRFVTVNGLETAEVERENLRVYLDEDGSSASWFVLVPRFKIDREGDVINSTAEMFLKSADGQNQYVHFSEKEVPDVPGARECNCSLNQTSFAMHLYSTYHSPENPILHAGDIIRLFEPELRAYLRFLPMASVNETISPERNDLYLETQSDASSKESSALWIVEKRHPEMGGDILFKDEVYRLRHLNTGRYISMRHYHRPKEAATGSRPPSRAAETFKSEYVASSKAGRHHRSVDLVFHAAHLGSSGGKLGEGAPPVQNESAIQIEVAGRYLMRGERHDELAKRFAEEGEYLWSTWLDANRTAAINLVVQRADDDSTVLDALCGVCALPHIRDFARLVRDRDLPALQSTGREHFVGTLMPSLINYLRSQPLSTAVSFRQGVIPGVELEGTRQTFLREQGVLTEVLDICEMLLDPYWHQEDEIGTYVSKACFAVLLNAITKNPTNQMHVADRLTVFIGHVSRSFLATKCIVEMLETNLELQESKVNKREIENFISMISKSNMNASYLNLLQSVCSCRGKGVDGNQCHVADLWLKESRHLQISLVADSSQPPVKASWAEALPTEVRERGTKLVGGYDLMSEGIPPLYLRWDIAEPLLQPDAIGGQDGQIPIGALFSQFDLQSGPRSNARLRKRVADYFVAQLNLAAEVCLDRNYIAMQLCEDTLPYDSLVAVLKTPGLQEDLRAAAVRLVTCLYVDSDPQSTIRIPRLSREWSGLPGDESSIQLPSATEGRTWWFALLQDILWEHLGDLDSQQPKSGGDSWAGSEYQLRLMELLLKLVQFRFYNNPQELVRVVTPLVTSLDKRESKKKSRIGQLALTASVSTLGGGTASSPGGRKKSATVSPELDLKDGNEASLVNEVEYPRVSEDHILVTVWLVLDHLSMMVFILVVTIVGVVLSFALPESTPWLLPFELTCSFFFLTELVLRMTAYTFVKGPIWSSTSQAVSFFDVREDPFPTLDFWIVVVDILAIIATQALGASPEVNVGTLARMGRMLRMVRLVRLARAARVMKKVVDLSAPVELDEWQLPKRYETTGDIQMRTMLQTVDILREITKITRDFGLSVMFTKFKLWSQNKGMGENPLEIFSKCYDDIKNYYGLSLDAYTKDFDLVFLDLCLYKHHDLVQSALNVMMIHHNLRELMLDDLLSSQLLVQEADQLLARDLREKLTDLQSCAERAELWSELETKEDHEINLRVKTTLRELADACRVRTSKLHGISLFRPNEKVQDMLRNLGAFEVALTVLQLTAEIRSGDGDEESDDEEGAQVDQNIREILRLCNVFLLWFIKLNVKNQQLAYVQLLEFTATLNLGIGSSLVVAEIFRGNEKLIKAFPPKLITTCADMLAVEMDPEYLDVLEALVWQSRHDAPNNNSIQYAIIKELTDPVRRDTILYLCQEKGSPQYEERLQHCRDAERALEQQLMEGEGASGFEDELSHQNKYLKYHTKLLYVLSGCAVGRSNITTVEAKLQVIYTPDEVLEALVDPESTVDITIPLAHFFFHAIIEVEIAVPGLTKNKLMWQFLRQCVVTFQDVIEDVKFLQDRLRDTSLRALAARRRILYSLQCAMIVAGFFGRYHNASALHAEYAASEDASEVRVQEFAGEAKEFDDVSLGSSVTDFGQASVNEGAGPGDGGDAEGAAGDEDGLGEGRTQATIGSQGFMWWDEIIADLEKSIHVLYDSQPLMLSEDHFAILYEAIEATTGAMSNQSQVALGIVRPTDLGSVCKSVDDLLPEADREVLDSLEEQHFREFKAALCGYEDLQQLIRDDKLVMVESLEKIPSYADMREEGDLRIEPLIQKLVQHTRSRLKHEGQSKYLDPDCSRSTKWFLQLYRAMIEKRWGMTIDERDDDGGEDEDLAAADLQHMFNKCGVTALCLDLASVGIDNELQLEAVKLMVALLFKEGGATEVQTTIYKHLNSNDSELFFEAMAEILEKMCDIYHYESLPGFEDPASAGSVAVNTELPPDLPGSPGGGDGEKEDEDPNPLEELPVVENNIIVIRFLQLMCEGHYEPNQDILREQPNARSSVNLMDKFVEFLEVVSKKQCRASTKAAAALTDTILEVIQGPCRGNQEHFALSTQLIEILNRMMRSKPQRDCDPEEEDEVKLTLLNIFEALLEGQGRESVIYERILCVIDLEVLQVMIVSSGTGEASDSGGELTDVQMEGLVLLQMFCDYQPSLKDEINLPERVHKVMGKDVTSVEVVWHGILQRRFFHVPEICSNLSEASKANLVTHVNRISQETKLMDFVERCYDINREIHHQEWLREQKPPEWFTHYVVDVNLAWIFSRQNQELATWIAFFTAFFINVLMMIFFKKEAVYFDERECDDDGAGCTELIKKIEPGSWQGPLEGLLLAGSESKTRLLLKILNVFNIALSSFTLILFLIVRVPVKYEGLVQNGMTHFLAAGRALLDVMTMYYLGYTVVALLAMVHSPVWQSVLLLDIIVKDTTTQAVLLAVVIPIKSLAMTAVLTIFVIYIFAFWIFTEYPNDFPGGGVKGVLEDCESLLGCFKVSLDYGMRLSGGIGDIMDHNIEGRLILDLLYFVIVLVILLNIVFGIIIDTFSELRSNKNERLKDTTEFCFICGKEKLEFDRASDGPSGFKDHIKQDHNMWDYLSFIIFIWIQDKDDDDGLELYVRKLIDAKDITWFPINKALCLQANENVEDSINEKIESMNSGLKKAFQEQSETMMRMLQETTAANRRAIADLSGRLDTLASQIQGRAGNSGPARGHAAAEASPSVAPQDPSSSRAGSEVAPMLALPGPAPQHRTPEPSDPKQAFVVQVIDARDLVLPHLLGSTDPFVCVSLFWNGSKVGSSETIWFGNTSPEWKNVQRNTFLIPISSVEDVAGSTLVIEVNHVHRRGAGHFLGCKVFSGQELVMQSSPETVHFRLGKKSTLSASRQAMVQGDVGLKFELRL